MQRLESLTGRFAREAMTMYARKTGTAAPAKDPWLAICKYIHAAIKVPSLEKDFTEPWTRDARLVLPSAKLPLHPSEIWGPVLAVCVLQGLAETISPTNPGTTFLSLFERLRLREPLARAFSLAGDVTEDGWRAAARVRLIFLLQALAAPKPNKAPAEEIFAGFPRSFWHDGDARWLMRVHDSGGKEYFNKELHQQILWWSQLLPLLQPAESKAAIQQRVQKAAEQAQNAGFQVIRKEEVLSKPAPEVAEKTSGKETEKEKEKKAVITGA